MPRVGPPIGVREFKACVKCDAAKPDNFRSLFCAICQDKNRNEYVRQYNKRLGENGRSYAANYRAKIKKETIDAYGGSCGCCGEPRIEFLTIDHINNDGAEERRAMPGKRGVAFYTWLRKNGFPGKDRYAVLCINCNMAIGLWKYCPHWAMSDAEIFDDASRRERFIKTSMANRQSNI